jgi:hypothetical protein
VMTTKTGKNGKKSESHNLESKEGE